MNSALSDSRSPSGSLNRYSLWILLAVKYYTARKPCNHTAHSASRALFTAHLLELFLFLFCFFLFLQFFFKNIDSFLPFVKTTVGADGMRKTRLVAMLARRQSQSFQGQMASPSPFLSTRRMRSRYSHNLLTLTQSQKSCKRKAA